MTSLWRKKKTRDTIAPDVGHNEQKHDNLSNPLDLLNEQKPDHLVNILPNLSIKSNMIWVDPPEGWKFGFPAIYDPEKDGQMSDWIISKGYPIQIIKEYGEQWMVRCWPAE
jgi:hypothetical protein